MYSFSIPFTAHHYCTLCLSHWCLGVEKKICKETMHYHHLYGTSLHKNPCPGISAIHKFGRPFLDHIQCTIYYVYLNYAQKKLSKEINQFYTFIQILSPLWIECYWIYNFPFPFPTEAKDWLSSSWEENNNGRRKMHDNSYRSPELIRWPNKDTR